ncbi:DUF721 domain-containing protein [Mariprofundus ferrooxydans]|uniref:DUF721 domain-containing protein n=1 Tax=Mariprofundus ferrooxydans PV-1 TaxID=314345 RepID=Q0F3G9_9PROT|nr:DUF721 domain-containing protein [Mariprofundus ferrooxydans]EAU55972.1 hypothetical protein SPV1_04108 [Mariprofundus ferrooxydans PV-1]KON48245.1 hypothetical protein AL013_04210 [Mariprofundus ferrooxydans]
MSRHNKRPHSHLTGLQSGLTALLGEDSLEQLIGIARLRRAWPHIVGPMMAGRTEPVSIEHLSDNGICLWVAVDHPIMAQQIRFLRDDIRKACFKHARMTNLHQIRSRVQPGAGIKVKVKQQVKAVPVTFSRKRELALGVACIKDRTLRRAAFQARLAQLAYDMAPHEGDHE